ncbi:hypothetical protein [Paractinoplanes hotanensis]|uniref:Uncharacterized protein n=1 Tax=Paractinoplanes hotanensis TaxID=2906497 RepID=A0ABT0YEU2_9ACTN|nr:hypothetical protein [Actinoplanes hotanensis]MCM4084568.1 hypothetical protein [Actinoplanes hotanensis]
MLADVDHVNQQVADYGGSEFEDKVERNRLLGREAISRPGESTRFAKAWLLASPAEAIRTEPVIALVEQLLDSLIVRMPAVAYDCLQQAVQVLNVFAREDDTTVGIAGRQIPPPSNPSTPHRRTGLSRRHRQDGPVPAADKQPLTMSP